MKNSLSKMMAAVLLAVLLCTNVQISRSSVATTKSEFDPIKSCNSWCYPSGYVCWLKLSNGGDLYCYGWDEPFVTT